MDKERIYEEYSSDRLYRFEIYKEKHYFDVRIQKKITDENMGPDWFHYSDISDHKHSAYSPERAIEIGREYLSSLSPDPPKETGEVIILIGTKKERINEAFRLSYTDVGKGEHEHFCNIYEKVGIRLLPAAESFYKQYGGVFRNHYVELDKPEFNKDLILFFYADLGETMWPHEMERRFEIAMLDIDNVRAFAGQEVCPVGDIGFYYPPVVYVGEDGRLYCVYEYKDEIDVYNTPAEIMADQLGNHMPVSLKEWKLK